MKKPQKPENLSQAPPDKNQMDREITDYLAKKYEEKVKIVAPGLSPEPEAEGPGKAPGVWDKINFDMKPEELIAYLDQYMVRQDEAKSVLATKVCTHFNRAKYLSRRQNPDAADGVGMIKNNILMIGPTGVGKTYMVKLIAAKLGVPFVKADATKFSETGYVGGDVEDLIRELVQEAGDDIELAQYGIIYVDEVDKIAASGNLIGPDVSRAGVQRALLKPMEETEVDLKTPHDPISQIQAIEAFRKTGEKEKRSVNTRHILFIMSGAFNDLGEIVSKRLNRQPMGFAGKVCQVESNQEMICRATPQDLVEYGFENEFIGRLPVQVVLEELSADDLYQILNNPNNPVVISKKRDFAAYGIDLRFEDEALRMLAGQAYELKTGARALVSVLEKALLTFEKHLPSTEVNRLLVTPELIKDPEQTLENVLASHGGRDSIKRFENAVQAERHELLRMIARRQSLYQDRLEGPLTPYGMDLIADEYYRSGLVLGVAFDQIIKKLSHIRAFEQSFYDQFSLEISFGEAAVTTVVNRAADQGESVEEYCQGLSQVLEPGLRLVRDRTGRSFFDLPEEAVTDTEGYLRRLFEEHYSAHVARDGAGEQDSNQGESPAERPE